MKKALIAGSLIVVGPFMLGALVVVAGAFSSGFNRGFNRASGRTAATVETKTEAETLSKCLLDLRCEKSDRKRLLTDARGGHFDCLMGPPEAMPTDPVAVTDALRSCQRSLRSERILVQALSDFDADSARRMAEIRRDSERRMDDINQRAQDRADEWAYRHRERQEERRERLEDAAKNRVGERPVLRSYDDFMERQLRERQVEAMEAQAGAIHDAARAALWDSFRRRQRPDDR